MKLTESKKRLLFEFIRYCVVGGTAFLVETATHWLLWKFVFTDTQSGVNIFIVTTIGFLVGLAVNYILSVVWVFTTEKQQKQGKTVKAFLIFALIGLVGYGIKVLLMYLGALCFGISYSDSVPKPYRFSTMRRTSFPPASFSYGTISVAK